MSNIVTLRTLAVPEPVEYDLDTMVISERTRLLRQLLENYDLTYQYSDDHRVWQAGAHRSELVRQVGETLPEVVYNDEWNRMVKKYFDADYLQTEEGKSWLR